MRTHKSRQRHTPVAIVAGGVLALTMLTGCSSGPLDTSCSEFNELSETAQTDIVIAWDKDSGTSQEMAEIGASGNLASFRDYCGDEAHADDKIRELELTFGF